MKKQKESVWIQTLSGRQFDLLNPTREQVYLPDIIRALSQINRFTGHTRFPYSVALHSVYMARALYRDTGDRKLAYEGLMHDATEAYVGDVSKPLKGLLPDYRRVEKRVERLICEVFKLPFPACRGLVKEYDKRIQLTERNALFRDVDEWPGFETTQPLGGIQILRSTTQSEVIHRFYDYFLLLAPPEVCAQHLAHVSVPDDV